MERRYSDMTVEELREEVAQLTEKARKAEQMGMVSEYAIHQRKILMAKAYTMNPEDFKQGQIYEIEGDPGHYFEIDYMNGIFAWGYRQDVFGKRIEDQEEQEAMPISILGRNVTG